MTLFLALTTLLPTAWAGGTCTEIDAGDILAVPPPAVIVLGERPGVPRDGRRAGRLVKKLGRVAPVTVALETVPRALQPVLDQYARGEIDTDDLDDALSWDEVVGLPYRSYNTLVTASVDDAGVSAIGMRNYSPPRSIDIPVPAEYLEILRDGMGQGLMPRVAEGAYLRFVAWRDHALAERALSAWDGRGYLVVVTHRARIEGGYGVPWQLAGLTDAPVEPFVLAWGIEPPCYAGDRVWDESVWESVFGG